MYMLDESFFVPSLEKLFIYTLFRATLRALHMVHNARTLLASIFHFMNNDKKLSLFIAINAINAISAIIQVARSNKASLLTWQTTK